MAGAIPRYTAQLVILTTEQDRALVEGLEYIMKRNGTAVSRADVLRQALEPGLKKLGKQYADQLKELRGQGTSDAE